MLLLIILVALFPFPEVAQAYVDPGTGSMFVQLLVGGIAGLVVALKMYGRKICAFLFGPRN